MKSASIFKDTHCHRVHCLLTEFSMSEKIYQTAFNLKIGSPSWESLLDLNGLLNLCQTFHASASLYKSVIKCSIVCFRFSVQTLKRSKLIVSCS